MIAKQIRQPAVAGRYYADDPARLNAFLDEHLLAPESTNGKVTAALIVPHAGYQFSGETAALAFAMIQPDSFEHVLLIGPTHHIAFHGISIAPYQNYRTPLGDVAVAVSQCESLVGSDTIFVQREDAHLREHAIEVELPFIQRLLPRSDIIPLVCGDITLAEVRRAAALLRANLSEKTLIVISSDFTHYGPNFGYLPFKETEAADRLPDLDGGAINEIVGRDTNGFWEYVTETGATICGRIPIAILLAYRDLGEIECEFRLIDYRNSGAILDDYHNSVSYASIAMLCPMPGGVPPADKILTESDKRLLLRVARDAIDATLHGDQYLLPVDAPSYLFDRRAAFISLHIDDNLRGCIGSIEARETLLGNVKVNAVNAAFHDPRFEPITPEEFAQIDIEISCIEPAWAIASLDEFVVGSQGIIMEKDGNRAIFLPQVASDQGWDKQATLEHLSRKAGLSSDAWRHGARFSIFESTCFSEHDFGLGPDGCAE